MDVCRNGLHQFIDAAATAQQLNLFLRHCGEEPDELDPAQLPDIIDHYVQGDPYRALAALEGVRTDREPGGLRRYFPMCPPSCPTSHPSPISHR